jgi:hemolysin activation/secretion protein
MILTWLLAATLSGGQCAQTVFENAKTESQEKSGIQGIFITGERKDILRSGRPAAPGIHIQNIQIPGGEEKLKKLLEAYLGKKLTKSQLIQIKQEVMGYYLSNSQSNIAVELPRQRTVGGVVQILVLQKKIGKPIYKGEIWYSESKLNSLLGLSPGREISEDTLQNNLSWLNRNPFHYTSVRFVPGENPDTVDLEFLSKQRRVLRFYGKGSNTGSAQTGYGRFSGGVTWGDAFWVGDLFTFEYSCSNEFKRFQLYQLNYSSLLPWKNIFSLLGSHAIVKPSSLTSNITGKATQVRARYTIPFKPFYTPFVQSLTAGFDFKNTNSNIIALTSGGSEVEAPSGPPVFKEINVTQVYANYTLKDELWDSFGTHKITLSLDCYTSPGDWLPHQSNSDYEKLRPNSRNRYFYAYGLFSDVYTMPKKWTLASILRGQIASRTLPSTELLGLGGYFTVRGYHERELSTDNGFIGNIEVRTPPFSLFRKGLDQLLFLAFLDYGIGSNWFVKKAKPTTGEDSKSSSSLRIPPHTQYLLGVGPGLRYVIRPYLQIRADYGFKLHRLFIPNQLSHPLLLGFGQFHLGVLASF